ncbi:MAG: M18 family aminopeptidase [Gammaproteobacteria bacterium]|nr:M18 family aminopeptidase [Gammaproteobacteria bacterium]
MRNETFNRGLLQFLDGSPTPFHAVANLRAALAAAGFRELVETAVWKLAGGGRYFVTRNGSAIIAFTLARRAATARGLRIVGAHTDSPCLKVKPRPEIEAKGYWQAGVEVYGGALLNPWFDRDLSLAGRVTLRTAEGTLENRLVDFGTPIATIPSLAIHLDREANDNRAINKQTYLPPVLALAGSGTLDLRQEVLTRLAAGEPALAGAEILDAELAFYDSQKAAHVGLRREFIASARLDNLLSCYTGLEALLTARPVGVQMLVCNDHEEVGSASAAGARGTFVRSVVERIAGTGEACTRAIAASVFVSTDNAHGVHPNFPDRHDPNHGPLLNGGPAIKVNAGQAYASNSETVAVFRHACALAGVPVQSFVSRGDVRCGSTIGPHTASILGVRTVDVGVPTFAMHSIRELAGSDDAFLLHRALRTFYELDDLTVG